MVLVEKLKDYLRSIFVDGALVIPSEVVVSSGFKRRIRGVVADWITLLAIFTIDHVSAERLVEVQQPSNITNKKIYQSDSI